MTSAVSGVMAEEQGSRARLVGTVALVALLIGIGIVVGARLTPRVAKVERAMVQPVREVRGQVDFTAALPGLVENACPAVAALILPEPPVAATSRRGAHPAAPLARQAFFVSGDGLLATAADGLPPDGLKVRLDDGRVLDATVRAVAPLAGLALLKVDSGGGQQAFSFAADDYPPLGLTGFVPIVPPDRGCMVQVATIATDFVADRDAARAYVRIVPSIEPAMIGAPLVNGLGQVVAVALPDPDDKAGLVYLPGSIAGHVVDELSRSEGSIARPFGLLADDLTPALARRLGSDRRGGAVVVAIASGSPAAAAGLRAGDVILSAGSAPIAGAAELSRTIGGDAPVPLTVVRGARTLTLTLRPVSQ